jgi:elongation factor Tu
MTTEKQVHLNIGTIGHVDHGKTTLSSALTKVLAKYLQDIKNKVKAYDEIDNAPEEKARGITINAQTIELNTKKRHYGLTDCPGHADFMKNMLVGAAELDCVILVLSGADSFQAQTKAHLSVITQMNIKKVIVFINKMDVADPDMLPLVEGEVEEEMAKMGYRFVGVPSQYDDISFVSDFSRDDAGLFNHNHDKEYTVIKGSGFAALNGDQGEYGEIAILKLLKILDSFIPDPQRDYTSPFLLYIEAIYEIQGRGTVIAGKVTRGVVKKGENIQILGQGCNLTTVVTEIQTFHKAIDSAIAGDNAALLLRGVTAKDVTRGAAACFPNSCKEIRGFKSLVSFWADEKANKKVNEKRVYYAGYEPQFFIHTASITGKVRFAKENWEYDESLNAEENTDDVKMLVSLQSTLAIPSDNKIVHTFAIREGNSTKGGGTIVETFEKMDW